MAHPIAIDYIRKTRIAGFSDEQIRVELEKSGWPKAEIENAFGELQKPVRLSELPQFVSRENVLENTVRRSSVAVSTSPASAAQVPRKSFAFIAGAGALLIAVGASAGGFWYYRETVVPARAVKNALASFQSAKTYRYEAELVITSKDSTKRLTENVSSFLPPFAGLMLHAFTGREVAETEGNIQSFKIRAKGAADNRDSNHPKGELTLTLGTRAFPQIGENIEMTTKIVDDAYYFQFTQLPVFDSTALLGYSMPRITEREIVGKWAVFRPATFENDYNEYIARLADIDPSFAAYRISLKNPTDLISKNEQAQIQKLWEEGSFIEWDKKVFSETVDGKAAYRIKGRLDRAQLGRFIEKVASVTGGSGFRTDTTDINRLMETLGNVEFNIWVSKDTERIIKTTAHTTVAPPDVALGGVIDFLLTIDFSGIDEQLAIETPAGAYDIKNAMGKLFADSAESLDASSIEYRDARRLRDVTAVRRHLETYRERVGSYPKTLAELVPEYMAQMPDDPKSKKSYRYVLKTKTSYVLSAELENRQHPILLRDANPKNSTYDVTPDDL